jgi:hypothetical protein
MKTFQADGGIHRRLSQNLHLRVPACGQEAGSKATGFLETTTKETA